MIELYSIRDVARILAVQESRLRYWMQTGFVGPTVRKGGRFYYTFCDLVAVKAAKDLLAADLPLQKARKSVEALKKALPHDTHPHSRLRVCSDGETIVALAEAQRAAGCALATARVDIESRARGADVMIALDVEAEKRTP